MQYAWRPHNDCRFSPIGLFSHSEYRSWASQIESAVGPVLFVGGSVLSQLFTAFQALTGGATRSQFHRSDVLVNSYTLRPMTPADIDACIAAGPSPPAALACPRQDYHWEVAPHRLSELKWTSALEGKQRNPGALVAYQTLVLNVGIEWWKEYLYPSSYPPACLTDGGVNHAYLPRTSLGVPYSIHAPGCEVFGVKYQQMAQGVARYLQRASRAFSGHVILVTSPPGVERCSTVTHPGPRPEPAPYNPITDEPTMMARYYYDSHRYAETVWKHAFQQWAPRLRFSVLNITQMSALRGDSRVNSDCDQFCLPGLPHVWAEMLLRLLEQERDGAP